MTRRPVALTVLADLPDPPRSGNHLRDLQTLAILAEIGYEVFVVAADHACGGSRGVGPRASLVRRVEVREESTSAAARLRRVVRLIKAATGDGHPGPWALPFEDAGLAAAVDRAVLDVQPDVLVLRSTLAHLARPLRSRIGTLVLDVHDAESFLARSLLALSSPWRAPVDRLRLAAAGRSELLTAIADEAWVPSEQEARHLRTLAPETNVIVVPNGVDVPHEFLRRAAETCELLLVGGFGYPPNEAAAVRLVEEILPLVQAECPSASVSLIGRDLRPELRDRWKALPVRWHGVVDILDWHYERATALVLAYDPSTNAGTPLKVAEAAARGLPVVATPNATEPLGLCHGVHVLNATNSAALAESVLRLIADPDAADALARRAHAWARENLDPQALARRLGETSILSRSPASVGGDT